MELPARIHVREQELLDYYNAPDYGSRPGETDVEEVEDYVGDSRPFKKIHVAQLVSYHLLGECEFVYVELD